MPQFARKYCNMDTCEWPVSDYGSSRRKSKYCTPCNSYNQERFDDSRSIPNNSSNPSKQTLWTKLVLDRSSDPQSRPQNYPKYHSTNNLVDNFHHKSSLRGSSMDRDWRYMNSPSFLLTIVPFNETGNNWIIAEFRCTFEQRFSRSYEESNEW